MRKLLCYMLLMTLTALLSACGDTSKTSSQGSSIKAVIKPTALTAGLNIGGVQMAITLPQSVTPPKNADGSWNESAIVEFVSSADSHGVSPTAKYNSADSVLEFSIIDLAGFTTEDRIVLHLILAPGVTPQASDFSVKSYSYFDKDTGAPISHTKPTLTVTIQ